MARENIQTRKACILCIICATFMMLIAILFLFAQPVASLDLGLFDELAFSRYTELGISSIAANRQVPIKLPARRATSVVRKPSNLLGSISMTQNSAATQLVATPNFRSHDVKDKGALSTYQTKNPVNITPLLTALLADNSAEAVTLLKITNPGYYPVNTHMSYADTRVFLQAAPGVNWGGSLGFAGLSYDAYCGADQTSVSNRSFSRTCHFNDAGKLTWLNGTGYDSTNDRSTSLLDYAGGMGATSNVGATESGGGFYSRVPDLSLVLPHPDNHSDFFEKNAIEGFIRDEDGTAQAVGILGRCDIATPATDAKGNVALGTCWGSDQDVHVLSGSDGYAVSGEYNITNQGSVSKQIGGIDKIGIKVVPGNVGNGVTAGMYMQGNAGVGFYTGFWMDQSALMNDTVSRFLKLPRLFEVTRDGTTLIGKSVPTATTPGTGAEIDPNGTAYFTNYNAGVTINLDSQPNYQRGINIFATNKLEWSFVTSTDGNQDLVWNRLNDGIYLGTPLRISKTTGLTTLSSLAVSGHALAGGSPPALSSCGKSPTISGSDNAGLITTGTSATACTLTFSTAYAARPYCIVTGESATVTYSVTKSSITIAAGAGVNVDYQCTGQSGG